MQGLAVECVTLGAGQNSTGRDSMIWLFAACCKGKGPTLLSSPPHRVAVALAFGRGRRRHLHEVVRRPLEASLTRPHTISVVVPSAASTGAVVKLAGQSTRDPESRAQPTGAFLRPMPAGSQRRCRRTVQATQIRQTQQRATSKQRASHQEHGPSVPRAHAVRAHVVCPRSQERPHLPIPLALPKQQRCAQLVS